MINNRANWKIQFHTFLTHIRHDIQKGVDNQRYKWQYITADRVGAEISVHYVEPANSKFIGAYSLSALGSEEKHSQDNTIYRDLTLLNLAETAKMTQETLGNNATIKKGNTMNKQTTRELSSLGKTVASQFQSAGAVALKMESGEALLKAVENLVLSKAGFVGKVKFRFMPELLDVMVAAGVSAIVAEYLPANKAAQVSAEAIRLAAMKHVTSMLPMTELVDTLTKGGSVLEALSPKD